LNRPIERIDSNYLEADMIDLVEGVNSFMLIGTIPLNIAQDMIDSGKYTIVNKITIAPK
jgi:hypothetical protein